MKLRILIGLGCSALALSACVETPYAAGGGYYNGAGYYGTAGGYHNTGASGYYGTGGGAYYSTVGAGYYGGNPGYYGTGGAVYYGGQYRGRHRGPDYSNDRNWDNIRGPRIGEGQNHGG